MSGRQSLSIVQKTYESNEAENPKRNQKRLTQDIEV